MGNAIIGATLLHLQFSVDQPMSRVGFLVTWRAFGSLFGNLLTTVLFERLAPEALLGVAAFISGCMTAFIPWCSSFAALVLAFTMFGFAQGIIGGGKEDHSLKLIALNF